ncbi:uncharacterized protein N7515_000333 [Penicillium bovifimosum]|uniref:DUF7728 domain-containing protein n=1 Tax=Penicillium bovifimosum TaxID=126998 RepID=A0A9W9HEX0_9EURO|nr:uncharacterized protein N7515_000333 [Penicillium bovifimosum]KAJ5145769.1 hypothetical protein N7515_000333 [Penicillium bovifimosum]
MFMRSALLGGVAALGASAMLVIPEMEPNVDMVEDGFVNVHPVIMEEAHHAVIELPCTDCPFRETNEGGVVSWMDGKPSSLTLHFSVADNNLLVNGRQIFPPAQPLPILAVQHNEDGEVSTPMPVGYALEIMPVAGSSDDLGYELLDIRFTVLDLETHPVPVDTVAIVVLQDPNGGLFITRTEIEKTPSASDHSSWKECHGNAKCLQEFFATRIQGLLAGAKDRVMALAKSRSKTCHGQHKGNRPIHPDSHGPHHHAFGSAHPHQHHQYNSAFARTFSRIVHFIVVPAVLGVLAGLTASAVGMLVGQAVIFFWQRHRGVESAEHTAAWENGDACEKQGLMAVPCDPEDVLPGYTEHGRVEEQLGKN